MFFKHTWAKAICAIAITYAILRPVVQCNFFIFKSSLKPLLKIKQKYLAQIKLQRHDNSTYLLSFFVQNFLSEDLLPIMQNILIWIFKQSHLNLLLIDPNETNLD